MKKVLIVDDQSFIRTMLKSQLSQLELDIVEASNGNEALGKAKVTHPDLILLDIVMPNKDGIVALQELKAYDGTKNIPVIVVSSHSDDEKVKAVMDAGAEKFIDKAKLRETDFVELVKSYL